MDGKRSLNMLKFRSVDMQAKSSPMCDLLSRTLQGQANKWVKNMEGKNGLKVLNLQMSDMVRQMEMALASGAPVLLQDVEEEMDPILEPVLSKSFVKRGNSAVIKLGDKEVMVTNFAVKEQGLEAQLLATVVKHERLDLDKQKNDLVVKVAAGKHTQVGLLQPLRNAVCVPCCVGGRAHPVKLNGLKSRKTLMLQWRTVPGHHCT
eukprot:scaffold20640_cov19-Tisochrysis_lutea.AAC.1